MGAQLQVASAALSVVQGFQQASINRARKAEYENSMKDVEIEALQKEEARELDLKRVLASLNASSSGGGTVLSTSGSSLALGRAERDLASKDISSIRLMGSSKKRQFGLSAKGQSIGATSSIIGGAAQGASTLNKYYQGLPEATTKGS